MFATCIFCHGALGRNESLEEFPVGRRLAFDAARGRLWVVCPSCKRWNLSPLETRWEAMEAAERLYRNTKTRVATDQIGLAKLREGLELVRVGKPLLPEFAAWRYGDVFTSRLRTEQKWGALSIAVMAAAIGLNVATRGNPVFVYLPTSALAWNAMIRLTRDLRRQRSHRVSISTNSAERLEFSPTYAERAAILPRDNGEWFLRVHHPQRNRHTSSLSTDIKGEAARRALASLLPAINYTGASRTKIREAVDHVLAETPGNLSSATSLESRVVERYVDSKRGLRTLFPSTHSELALVPMHIRLAMEMSLHEADERRALEGELHELESRWREAEEIAAIADGLLLPDTIDTQVRTLRTSNQRPPKRDDQ